MIKNITELRNYAFVWESFNQAENIADFKERIEEKVVTCSIDDEIFFISAVSRFFTLHNVFLETPEHGILSRIKITDPLDNCFIKLIAKSIRRNRLLLEKDKDRNDIFYFTNERYEAVMSMLDCLPLNDKEKREIIEGGVRRAFKFSIEHQLTFEDDRIVISHVVIKTSEELDFEFIYEKESEEYYKYLISDVVASVLKTSLNLSMIDNIYFHKNYERIFTEEIKNQIEPHYDSSKELLEPFCEYLFKKYQNDILLEVVDKIFALIEGRDPNIAKFINFYNGNSSSIDGVNYEKPSIIVGEVEWSYNKILSTIQSRQEFKEDNKLDAVERGDALLDRMRKNLLSLEKKRDEFEGEDKSSKEYQDILFDIELTEKDILNRENRKKNIQEEGGEILEKFQKYNDQIQEIKKAVAFTIESFTI